MCNVSYTGLCIEAQPGQTILIQRHDRDDGTTKYYVKFGYLSEDGTKLLMPDDTRWTPIEGCEAWLQQGSTKLALVVLPEVSDE